MDIGTAKPTKKQQQKVPHHLIDVAEPDEIWSLSMFQNECNHLIDEIQERGKVPILVGGIGQYIRAIVEGWEIPPQEPDNSVRNVLESFGRQIGPEALYEKLKIIDPIAASKIDPQNLRRTVRALEVIFLTGEKFSEQRKKHAPLHQFWIIGLIRPRGELYKRIDERIDKMIEQGLIDETEKLLRKGYSQENPNLSAIGYREISQYVQGRISLEDARVIMKRKTREFVRRQANWFKPDDPSIHWYEMDENAEAQIIEDMHIGNIFNDK
jgi:tRNA dimethylallyltransferase